MLNTSATLPVIFKWFAPTTSGTEESPIVSYEIQIANDVNFTNNAIVTPITATEYSQLFTTIGDRFWRVKAKDKAGNIGIYGTTYKLTIN